jgi:hypothetical protein
MSNRAPLVRHRGRLYRSLDGEQRRPRRRQLLLLSGADLWVMKIQRGKSVDHRRRDGHTREPFVVRRHYIPELVVWILFALSLSFLIKYRNTKQTRKDVDAGG